MSSDKPVLIEGGLSVDDRGQIAFCNGFDFADSSIRRLYLTSNHRAGQVRAWHAHKRERKFVMAVSGSAWFVRRGLSIGGSHGATRQSAGSPSPLRSQPSSLSPLVTQTAGCR